MTAPINNTWYEVYKHLPQDGQRVRVLIRDPLQGRIYENPQDAICKYHLGSRELPYFYEIGTNHFLSFVDKWKPIVLELRGFE